MFGKNNNRRSSLTNSENRKGNPGDAGGKRRNKKRMILLTCLLAALVVIIGIGSVILFGSRGFASDEPVTATFDSTGGTPIASQTVAKGETLTEVAAPSRNGYLFAGWYYEEAPVNAYHATDLMSADTTLYAGWIEPNVEGDIQEYIRDCDPNITFVVHSEVVLTDENLSGYIHFSCVELAGGEALSVKPEGDGYLLYSKESLTPGLTYSIEILDTRTVFFEKAGENIVSDSSIRAYNFTVYRENENHVEMKAEPKLLSSDDVASLEIAGVVSDGQTGNVADNGKTIYRAKLVTDDSDYQVGDIISLGSGLEDAPENQYYRVVAAVANSADHSIDLITPNLEDIYSELEIYYSGDAVYFEEEEETKEIRATEQDMKISLLGSKGYSDLCTNIATGIKESPTVKSTVATLSKNNQKRFAEMSVSDLTDLLQNVEVHISIQKTYDADYQENGIRGVVMFSTGDIDIPLGENIKLTINLTLTNDITETAHGFISPQKDLSLNIYKSAIITNHCNLNFDAVIATSSGEEKINITEEIQNLVNSTSKDKTQEIVDSMNQENFFGDDLDYVEIFNKELGNKTVFIFNVLTIQFKLNFHVDIGMRVGLNLNFDSTEVRNVGLSNLGGNGIQTINQRLSSNTHFTAILKGQIGIRAGFKAEVNFSMVHLNDVLNFGFTIDVGVYEEISGFVRFDYDSTNGISLVGGLRSETGIYVTIDFSWMLFGWQDSLTIAEFKFPILTIGTLEFASEFAEAENAVTFDTSTFNAKINGNNDLLRLKYVDISGGANGVTVNIKPASMSEDYKFYLIKDQTGKGSLEDIKYASIDAATGMISIAQNAPERLDFTVVVQYTKGCSLFTKDYQPITKQIHMTYMKVKVDDINQKFTASFYWPDGSVMEQKDYYVGQIPVPPSEDIYENAITISAYNLVNWSKPWKEEIKAIYANIDYHMDWVANVRNISYYGDVYNEATGQYQYGLIAAIPSLYSLLPTPPSVEGMNIEPGWEFSGWSPALREAYSDYSYSAQYKQDPAFCFCNFYVNGNRVSYGYVKKGETPAVPDMNQYSTSELVFTGWWPSLGPTTGNYQRYEAVFRKYVNVTFKNLDGSVLSGQRVLAGETPAAPKVDGVIKGEENYYEKHFQYWMTDEAAKLGPVYSDTICTPLYTRQYLEVKTVFNAGDHAFADGTKTKEFIGTYATNNFIYLPQVTYSDLGKTYTVDYWQSTEMLNGSYVKLYMKDLHTDFRYNLTFNPVFKTGAAITYTVRFDGGDQPIYLTGQYGDFITADQLTALKKTSPSVNYYCVVINYGLTLPYSFGSTIGADGQPAVYISAVARFEDVGVDKTFTFDANSGAFADGETTKTVTAPYATSCTFSEVPVKQPDNLYTYTFIGWADEKDATTGSLFSNFVINDNRTLYAVYTGKQREYTVTFDANNGAFADGETTKTVTAPYATNCTFNEVPIKQPDNMKRYIFIGWADEKDAATGTSYDNFVINGNRTLYAVYTETQEEYTFAFDANSGAFADGETIKTVTALYATSCTFTKVPIKQPDNLNMYVFIGWADEKDAATGTSYDNFVINGNRTLYAVYTATQKDYKVTFDLSGGNISGETAPVVQTYHYGETIVPPAAPSRPDDITNRYVFLGWQPTPPEGATVTASRTYTAEYRAIRIDGMMDETGIIVSDGSSYEDICVNGIPGYTYTYAYVGAQAVPTLTITGNGLTFSGTSDEVCVVIEAGVTEVTFENLTLSGEYAYSEVLVATDTPDRLNIRISGACVMNNTRNDGQGLRFERPVLLEGVGSEAMFTIEAQGNYAVYCADDFDVDSLELVINANNTAIGNDEGAGEEWRFTDSVIRLNAGGTACQTEHAIALYDSDLIAAGTGGLYCARIEISGTSVLDVSVSGEDATAIGTRGDLVFSNFTGSFGAGSTNSTSSGFAVMVQGEILFLEGGTAVSPTGYNLGGTQVFVSDDHTYSSFGIWVEGTLKPASSVSVTKP